MATLTPKSGRHQEHEVYEVSELGDRPRTLSKINCAPISHAVVNFTIWVTRLQRRSTKWFEKLPPVVWFDSKFPGWQAGVVVGIFLSVFVLIFNVVFLIVAMRHHWGLDGLGTLVEGNCDVISKWNKVAHAFINIMSTMLLIQSNYCMQLLASPTRHDVDFAHKKREWVDIGIQSFRNVWKRHISPWRCLLWIVLAISSVPLHLLWNSVVIFSPSAYQYNQLAVTDSFVKGLPFRAGYVYLSNAGDGVVWPDSLYFLQEDLQSQSPAYQTLSNTECKQAYAQSFVKDRSDVIVVTKPKVPETNESIVLGGSAGGSGPWPYKWLCPSDSTQNFKCLEQVRQQGGDWKFPNYENPDVEYCLSKKMDPQCKLQYGFWIALFTIIANIFKTLCFIATFRLMKSHTKFKYGSNAPSKWRQTLLITTGDAIASFLEYPDSETLGMSIVEREDFRNGIWDLRWVNIGAMIWRTRYERSWFRAVGSRKWITGLVPLGALAFLPTVFLLSKLSWFMNDIGITQAVIRQLGIGNPSGLFLFGSRVGGGAFRGWRLLGKVALANLPQLFVSMAYYLWNNHLAAMIAAREYDMYAAPTRHTYNSTATDVNSSVGPANKRGLRVTDPLKGSDQKSTRFLTVPLRYGVTNIVLWVLLHYLASQAIFFARVDILDHWLEVTDWSISQVGYSVLGLIYFLTCAHVVFVYAVCVSLRRLPNRMPLAATCSGALSAACHPKDPWINHHEMRVQWGVEIEDRGEGEDGDDEKKISRCTFTSGEAYYPVTGRYYA